MAIVVLAAICLRHTLGDVVETTLDDFLEGEEFDREDLRQREDSLYADDDAYGERDYETKYQRQQQLDTDDSQQRGGQKEKPAPVEPWMIWAAYGSLSVF